MLTAAVNLSEGRDANLLAELSRSAGTALLDLHSDPDHNRSVFTLGGAEVEDAARALARRAVALLDISGHSGVHPRIGVVDVVPWVNLVGAPLRDGPAGPGVDAQGAFAAWASQQLDLPCFLYGPAVVDARGKTSPRTLPEVRRRAWHDLLPDTGPLAPHPTAGAVAVGARPALVAYNLWLLDADLDAARRVAREIRGDGIRALGLAAGGSAQVSCNLIDPWRVGPGAVFDLVARLARIDRAELVGLLPEAVLAAEPHARWSQLDLGRGATIEARLEKAGLDGGRSK